MGVPQAAFDVVASSGQTTRHWLEGHKGGKLHFLGASGYSSILQGLDVQLVGIEQAEFVLISSLVGYIGYQPEDYICLLEEMHAKTLLLICANPDHMVEVGGLLQFEPGAIASLYEAMGGKVVYTGKPHAPIYDFARAELFEKYGHQAVQNRSLAIGDSLRTDMAGAKAQGIAALLIEAGVNRSEVMGGALSQTLSDAGLRPLSVLPYLSW
jgi:HAD superfamily hydrolase (TIGR01459 family)